MPALRHLFYSIGRKTEGRHYATVLRLCSNSQLLHSSRELLYSNCALLTSSRQLLQSSPLLLISRSRLLVSNAALLVSASQLLASTACAIADPWSPFFTASAAS